LKNPIKLNYQNSHFITPINCTVLIDTILKQHLHHVSTQEQIASFKNQFPSVSCYL